MILVGSSLNPMGCLNSSTCPREVKLSLVWYLFNVVSGNRYLTRGSSGNALTVTTTGNVFVTS